jgi:hypothetical protein
MATNQFKGPPKDIPATDLFRKLCERPLPGEVIDFGGELGRLRVQVLRLEQHDDARMAAHAYCKEKRRLTDDEFRTRYGEELLGDATAAELIALAVTLPDPIGGDDGDRVVYPRVFRNGADVKQLSPDEVTLLFGAYLKVQQRFGPYERTMDDVEVNAWVERLMEGGSELPLSLLASHQRDALTMSLAARALSLSCILSSPPESLPSNLESAPTSWVLGTSSSSEPAAESTGSDRVITAEEAMEAAKNLIGRV